jgi:hypothetical protein
LKTFTPLDVPNDPAALPGFLRQLQAAIQQAANRAEPFTLRQVLHAEPTRMLPGMEVIADGTDFDPSGLGTGEGTYRRNSTNTAWVFVG